LGSGSLTMTTRDINEREYVTATIGEQMFGLPIDRVQDVFVVDRVTRVPLSQTDVVGVMNLRGRIVTVIDMGRRLGLPSQRPEAAPMAIGVDDRGESYGLLIDEVGEVLTLSHETREVNPANLDATLAAVSVGVHRLDGKVLVVLDVDRILDFERKLNAA
jgi:purine-binding chemotaxis protein CheW